MQLPSQRVNQGKRCEISAAARRAEHAKIDLMLPA